MKTTHRILIACGLAGAAALAQAQSSSADMAAAIQLEPQTENGVTYLCGGIGKAEAAQMKRDAPKYNLMLTFAENTGAYLADVGVHIADARGNTVLDTRCGAPILLVNFPRSGSYRIKAEVAGLAMNRTVHVSGRGRAVSLLWPSRLVDRATPPQG